MRSSQDLLATRQPSFYARHSGATQRARLLDAVTRVVADKGFSGATVSDIVTAAGVSRTTFYEHFEGKRHCVLTAYATATDIVLAAIHDAVRNVLREGWHAALAAGLRTYFDAVRTEPATARMLFLEVRALGPDGIAASAAAQTRHVGQIVQLATAFGFDEVHLDALGAGLRLVIAGIEEQVAQALHAENPAMLDEIERTAVSVLGAMADTAGLSPRA